MHASELPFTKVTPREPRAVRRVSNFSKLAQQIASKRVAQKAKAPDARPHDVCDALCDMVKDQSQLQRFKQVEVEINELVSDVAELRGQIMELESLKL